MEGRLFTLCRCAKHNLACQHSRQTQEVDPMLIQCLPTICNAGQASKQHWFSVPGAGQYPFSPSQYPMLAGAQNSDAAADSEMEVSAYFTSVHITVVWKGCDKQCCRQRSVLIPFFGRAVPGKRERKYILYTAERKYILDLQVSTYSLLACLATLLHTGQK